MPTPILKARYIGNPKSVRKRSLKGKTALAQETTPPSDFLLLQFDDVGTGLGYGWHKFPKALLEVYTL